MVATATLRSIDRWTKTWDYEDGEATTCEDDLGSNNRVAVHARDGVLF